MNVRAGLAKPLRLVLLTGDGMSNTRTAELVGASHPRLLLWRNRFIEHGINGLHDDARGR